MVVREFITKLGFKTDEKSLKNFEQRTKKALAFGGKLALGVSAALLGIGIAAVKAGGDMEMMTTQFEVMLGSAEKATDMMGQLKQFASTTPFALADLAKGTTNLIAGGVAAGEAVNTMRMLGDTAGGSAEKLQGLVLGYQKMKSTGKASLEVLNIFAERGVPVFAEMQKNLGITKEQFFKMVSAGKIATKDVTNAFKTMTSEGGMFFKGMEKQSLTFQGMVSTMKDNFKLLAASIGEGLLPMMKEFVGVITTLAQGPLKELAEGLTKVLIPVFKALLELLPALIKMLVPILTMAGDLIGQILTSLMPIVLKLLPLVLGIVESLMPLIAFLVDVIFRILSPVLNSLGPILGHIKAVIDAMIPIIMKIVLIAAKFMESMTEELMNLINELLPSLVALTISILGLIEALLPILTPILNIITKIIVSLITKLQPVIQFIIKAIMVVVDSVTFVINGIMKLFRLTGKKIPELAKIAEENDPAAQLKKNAASLAGGAGTTTMQNTLTAQTDVTVNGNASASTAKEIGNAVAKATHAAFSIELKKILVESSS